MYTKVYLKVNPYLGIEFKDSYPAIDYDSKDIAIFEVKPKMVARTLQAEYDFDFVSLLIFKP